jgi:beta-carotene 3-hydroxylase
MNSVSQNILIVIITFFAMESVAWLAHKYLMHGLLWFLHTDHHKRDDKQFFEKNDYFFLIFATPGITCLYLGLENFTTPFWIGLGITIYGFAYFLVHDIFIHQRFNLFKNTDSVYLRAIRKAHKVHHKRLTKEHGECFGMLWVPMHYFKEASKARLK